MKSLLPQPLNPTGDFILHLISFYYDHISQGTFWSCTA